MTTEQKQKLKTSDMGPIHADAVYGFEQFQKRTGQGRTALRSFRMQGLRVIRAGNRRYILGSDWIEFLKQHASRSVD